MNKLIIKCFPDNKYYVKEIIIKGVCVAKRCEEIDEISFDILHKYLEKTHDNKIEVVKELTDGTIISNKTTYDFNGIEDPTKSINLN